MQKTWKLFSVRSVRCEKSHDKKNLMLVVILE